jgi:hypothetical protein
MRGRDNFFSSAAHPQTQTCQVNLNTYLLNDDMNDWVLKKFDSVADIGSDLNLSCLPIQCYGSPLLTHILTIHQHKPKPKGNLT